MGYVWSKLHSLRFRKSAYGYLQKLRIVSLLLFRFTNTYPQGARRIRKAAKPLTAVQSLVCVTRKDAWIEKWGLLFKIVTHSEDGMCYNSVTVQVFVSFTMTFVGVSLASTR